MSRRHKQRQEVFAVVRYDLYHGKGTAPEVLVTVKEVVWSMELAIAEVERLNALNADKGCVYFWQTTRLFPPGVSAGRDRPSGTRAKHLKVVNEDDT